MGALGDPRRRVRVLFAGLVAVLAALILLGGAAAADDDTIVLTNGDKISGVDEGHDTDNRVVARFTDTGNTTCDLGDPSGRYSADIDWGDGTDASSGSFACETEDNEATGTIDVLGSHTYADSGEYKISVTVIDNKDETAVGPEQTDTASINDVEIDARGADPISGAEGQTLNVTAFFEDFNAAGFDSGLSALIDWGDGHTSKGVVKAAEPCECDYNVVVTGSHVFDAPIPASAKYEVTVTLLDDGGSQASQKTTASIADAELSAGAPKQLMATAYVPFSGVVASFHDAAGAQAAAADFKATIQWGDGSSSLGTVKRSGVGAFDVSGSHTYSSPGSRSLTIKVNDEEGASATMRATMRVAAGPRFLPFAGQPRTPPSPVLPIGLLPFGLLALGGAGSVALRFRRR